MSSSSSAVPSSSLPGTAPSGPSASSVPSVPTVQAPRSARKAANDASQHIMDTLDKNLTVVRKTGASHRGKHGEKLHASGCTFFFTMIGGQLTLIALVRRELRDQYKASVKGTRAWAEKPFARLVCEIEHHDVVCSARYVPISVMIYLHCQV
jgi:hypothetical protein